jgi:hypothetical protein
MENMNISSAQYLSDKGINVSIKIVINDTEMTVPLDPENRHYAEIMRQVNEGTLTIADAE